MRSGSSSTREAAQSCPATCVVCFVPPPTLPPCYPPLSVTYFPPPSLAPPLAPSLAPSLPSAVLEGGEYNGTIRLLRLDLPAARALLRDTPQLLPALAAPRDGTTSLSCLPDTTVVVLDNPDPLNSTALTTNASACSPDKAVAYLVATGEQGLSVSFAERGTLQWSDLEVRGWPGGNYTLAITVTGPSPVRRVLAWLGANEV